MADFVDYVMGMPNINLEKLKDMVLDPSLDEDSKIILLEMIPDYRVDTVSDSEIINRDILFISDLYLYEGSREVIKKAIFKYKRIFLHFLSPLIQEGLVSFAEYKELVTRRAVNKEFVYHTLNEFFLLLSLTTDNEEEENELIITAKDFFRKTKLSIGIQENYLENIRWLLNDLFYNRYLLIISHFRNFGKNNPYLISTAHPLKINILKNLGSNVTPLEYIEIKKRIDNISNLLNANDKDIYFTEKEMKYSKYKHLFCIFKFNYETLAFLEENPTFYKKYVKDNILLSTSFSKVDIDNSNYLYLKDMKRDIGQLANRLFKNESIIQNIS